MTVDDNFISNYFFSNKNKYRHTQIHKATDKIIEYISNRFNDSDSLIESIYRIHFKIFERPVCKICGGKVKFEQLSKEKNYFSNTCCRSCGNKYRHIQKEAGTLKKYGTVNVWNLRESQDKCCATKLEKYGDPYFNNNEKTVKTCLEKYGVRNGGGSKEVVERNKQYFLDNYGVTSPAKLDSSKRKSKETCLEKYGYEYSHQHPDVRKKTSETMSNFSKEKRQEISKKQIETYNKKTPEEKQKIRNKVKNTCLKRYGVTSVFAIKEIIEKSHSPEVIKKIFEKQKLNGTISTSKPELETFKLLKTKFSDIIHQYRDENRYPFRCDFYIPSIDMFIECQYGFFHNKRPFTNSKEDIKELNEIILKNERLKQESNRTDTRYDRMINTWTVIDVKKRKIAKENNLNFLEFYTFEDFKEWFNEQ